MSKYDRELALAQMRAAPKRVTYACSVAWLLGIVIAMRILLLGSAPLGRSLLFAAMTLFTFGSNGMFVLGRSRLSYALLILFAALPLPGSFGYSVHLLVMPLTGDWQSDLRGVTTGLFGMAQMTIIIYLFRNLFSRDVLSYVWKQPPPVGPAVAEAQNV
ncbi:MAG: hypothetical protein AABN95_09855 [Acidobacteriota bacterium]